MRLENDKIQILLRNAKQILTVATATFPSFEDIGASQDCEDAKNDVDELACRWRAISQSLPVPDTEDARSEAWILAVTKVNQMMFSVIFLLIMKSG